MRSVPVLTVTHQGGMKELEIPGGTIIVPSSRGLRPGDNLIRRGSGLIHSVVGGAVTITPSFVEQNVVPLGSALLEMTIREPQTIDDLEAAERLRSFHYRGGPPFGRQGVLLAFARMNGGEPESCGLIEVGAAPICNRARDRLLDAPFSEEGVSWTSWDYKARGTNCKRIAEISRVVVDPDYRGLGISTVLLRAATRYCAEYWELGGSKPLFAEIVADMLRYHDFPLVAGYSYCGQTEGNLRRVAKDLRYLISRLEQNGHRQFARESSAERMQWKYARSLALQVGRQKSDMGWVLNRLETVDRSSMIRHLGLFQDVIRLPKPVFLKGLTPKTDRFVELRAHLNVPSVEAKPEAASRSVGPSYRLRKVRVDFSYRVSSSKPAKEVCLSFGMRYPRSTEGALLIDGIIPGGSVVLVTGRSGAGKTTLMRLLAGSIQPTGGDIVRPHISYVATPREPAANQSLIDALGDPVGESLAALSWAGLSEPSTYLRPFETLSDGQKERGRLAILLRGGARCWLVDRFVEGLDPLVGRVVASRFARAARRLGVTLIVASARWEEIATAMEPDLQIALEARRPAVLRSRPETPLMVVVPAVAEVS